MLTPLLPRTQLFLSPKRNIFYFFSSLRKPNTMLMRPWRFYLTELVWIVALTLGTIWLSCRLFICAPGLRSIDFMIHTTYMVLRPWEILIPMLAFSFCLVYGLRAWWNGFSRKYTLAVSLASGLVGAFWAPLQGLIWLVSQQNSYPLSLDEELFYDPFYRLIWVCSAAVALVFPALIYLGYRWGRINKRK